MLIAPRAFLSLVLPWEVLMMILGDAELFGLCGAGDGIDIKNALVKHDWTTGITFGDMFVCSIARMPLAYVWPAELCVPRRR